MRQFIHYEALNLHQERKVYSSGFELQTLVKLKGQKNLRSVPLNLREEYSNIYGYT